MNKRDKIASLIDPDMWNLCQFLIPDRAATERLQEFREAADRIVAFLDSLNNSQN